MKTRLQVFFALLISGCIGTDYLEDPIVGERIDVSPQEVALMPGQTFLLEAVYYDQYGIEREDVILTWLSSKPEIAAVNASGLVTAFAVGQATISATFQGAQSVAVNVNVVTDENAVASVVVTSPKMGLVIGEKVKLEAVVKNIHGTVLEGREVMWFTENSSIVTVDDSGEVTGVANGRSAVHAKSEDVKSNSVDFVIGTARVGQFVSAGGYKAEGTAVLRIDNGNLMLDFDDGFNTSFAGGTFVYLSNTTSGSGTYSNGVEIAQITTNGAKSFNVSAVDPEIGLFDYRYVIILCKPARVIFGYADMN
jgi:hypothetical protein